MPFAIIRFTALAGAPGSLVGIVGPVDDGGAGESLSHSRKKKRGAKAVYTYTVSLPPWLNKHNIFSCVVLPHSEEMTNKFLDHSFYQHYFTIITDWRVISASVNIIYRLQEYKYE